MFTFDQETPTQMNIKDFVETTLTQIVEGTNAASVAIKDSGALITSNKVRALRDGTTNNAAGDLVSLIEFDIAVTVNETDKADGSAGIKIAGFSLGGALGTETTNQTVSRIKFSVPLQFPAIG